MANNSQIQVLPNRFRLTNPPSDPKKLLPWLTQLIHSLNEDHNLIARKLQMRAGVDVTANQPAASEAGQTYLLTDSVPLTMAVDDGGTWHNWTLQTIQFGQVTVSGASTTGTASFSTAFSDTNYQLSITPISSSGSPASGSNRPLSVSKSAGQFTLTTEVAPGGGNSQTFDYIAVHA